MADSLSPAKDLFEYMRDNAIGTEGVDLFYNYAPGGKDGKEAGLRISIMDTGGYDPDLCINPADVIRRPTVQVMIRGKKYGFTQAYTKAKEIVALIDQKYNLIINSTRYISIKISGHILDLGRDTNECSILTINFVTDIAPYLDPVVTTAYENDYTGDPIGPFSILNSDYIDASLTYGFPAGSTAGEITADGFVSDTVGAAAFIALEGFDFSKEVVVDAAFKIPSGGLLSLITRMTAAAISGDVIVIAEDGGNLSIIGSSGLNSVLISGPETNWITKDFTITITQNGNDSDIVVTADSVEIYSDTVTNVLSTETGVALGGQLMIITAASISGEVL